MTARGLPESPVRARSSEVHLDGGQGVQDGMEGGREKGRGERTGRFCRTHMVISAVQPRAPHTKDA